MVLAAQDKECFLKLVVKVSVQFDSFYKVVCTCLGQSCDACMHKQVCAVVLMV